MIIILKVCYFWKSLKARDISGKAGSTHSARQSMINQSLFNEAVYLAKNPLVAKAVAEGKYPSGYEEYLQVGQFQERSGVIFEGTSGSDTVQAAGQKSSVIGVKVESAEVGSRLINAKTSSLGVGEVDILLGSPGRNIFYLGDNAKDTPVDFYLGNGNKDYGIIRNFDPTSEDAIYLAGNPKDYTFTTIDGSVNIAKNGDLIGIVEGVSQLIPDGLFTEKGFVLLGLPNSYFASRTQPYFNEPAYLAANPDVKKLIEEKKYTSGWDHLTKAGLAEGRQTFFNGKVGNDSFFYPLGNATVSGVPITDYDPLTKTVKTATLASGDRDHYHGSWGQDRFLLSSGGKDHYVGQGDKDYTLIGDFDRAKDQLLLSKDIGEYKLDIYEDNFGGVIYKEFQLSTKDGDAIVRIEDGETLKLVQIPSDVAGTKAFVSTEYEGLDKIKADALIQDFMKSDGLIDIKIQDGQNIKVSLTEAKSDAMFSNTVGFYRVQDTIGTVIDPTDNKSYKPGDVGYALAAVRSSQSANSGVSFGIKSGATPTVDLAGGYFYAPFLVVNSTIDKVLNATGSIPEVFFKFGAANSDGISHVKMLDANTIGFEDLKGGGDLDFNDAVFKVNTALIV